MVAQACNHSTSEAEAGGLVFQDPPWLFNSFKASPRLQTVSAFKFTTLHFCAELFSVAVVTRPCNLHTRGAETDRFLQLAFQSMSSMSLGLGSVRGCVIKTHKQKNKSLYKRWREIEEDIQHQPLASMYIHTHIYTCTCMCTTHTHTAKSLSDNIVLVSCMKSSKNL